MKWIKTTEQLPAQGLKILCFHNGDLWIARRFSLSTSSYWVEIPYGGDKGANLTDEPEYWTQLSLPGNYTGLMQVGIEGEGLMSFDEFQKSFPEDHELFVSQMIKSIQEEQ